MSLPSRTPVTDGGGIVRHVPSCAIAPLLVPTFIAQITGTSALILIAISASGLVLTNVTATTATGNDATDLRCAAVSDLFSGPLRARNPTARLALSLAARFVQPSLRDAIKTVANPAVAPRG
jgi:hypothetical protein